MKKKLYEIEKEQALLLQEIEAAEGEMSEELIERMEINDKDKSAKGLAYICLIKELKNDVLLHKEEKKRLDASIKRFETKIEWMEGRLKASVESFGEFNAGTFKVTTSPSYSMSIEDEDLVPSNYISYETIKKLTIDKAQMKKDLRADIKIEGATLIINKNLKIK